MVKILVAREARLPDDLRVSRSLSAPHLGPRILFCSGGSALNAISRHLKRYTFNSVHMITPFDSGGSSQVLREAFDMPAVGDLRSRLMALADETDLGQPDIFALFTYRLPKTGDRGALKAEVAHMVSGEHPLIRAVAQPMRVLIRSFLQHFAAAAPADFDFRNASIGNLILAGGYISNDRLLEPVLFLMSKMVDVRGTVRAVVDANLHLGVDLADERRIIGQRNISGKEAAPITVPIQRVFLSDGTRELPANAVPLPERNRRLIARADLICYPPGSLFSSVIANLLPAGVGTALAARDVPKVFVPSLGHDPEAIGLSLADQVSALLSPLRADAGPDVAPRQFISHVLCDGTRDIADAKVVTERFAIPVHRMPLCGDNAERYDPKRICDMLVSLA